MRQANLPTLAPQALPDVRPGDIFTLGRHRLMCGDATSKSDVSRLFLNREPTLLITSPPYAQQRDYDRPIACWDSMMLNALNGHKFSEHCQLLINLGVIHAKGEWLPFWFNWLTAMRRLKWRVYAQYVWSKTTASPGWFAGRLNSSHEFVFHIHRQPVDANKWVPSKFAGQSRQMRSDVFSKNGIRKKRAHARTIHQTRVPFSVIEAKPTSRTEASGHPAQMPIQLSSALIRTWKKPFCLIYDCFAGSGTTLLAAEQENADCVAMEIAPAYVSLALNRWAKLYPAQPIRRLNQ